MLPLTLSEIVVIKVTIATSYFVIDRSANDSSSRKDLFWLRFMLLWEYPRKILCIIKYHGGRSRVHLAVPTEWVSSQTNESHLCKLSSSFTMGLYGSLYDYIIHVALIASFQHPLGLCLSGIKLPLWTTLNPLPLPPLVCTINRGEANLQELFELQFRNKKTQDKHRYHHETDRPENGS